MIHVSPSRSHCLQAHVHTIHRSTSIPTARRYPCSLFVLRWRLMARAPNGVWAMFRSLAVVWLRWPEERADIKAKKKKKKSEWECFFGGDKSDAGALYCGQVSHVLSALPHPRCSHACFPQHVCPHPGAVTFTRTKNRHKTVAVLLDSSKYSSHFLLSWNREAWDGMRWRWGDRNSLNGESCRASPTWHDFWEETVGEVRGVCQTLWTFALINVSHGWRVDMTQVPPASWTGRDLCLWGL